MDMATIGGRYLRKAGLLDDMEVSEENNACSIYVDVDVDGRLEKWLLMFKNETHNHPTEIEPFGGAATCLGGAIMTLFPDVLMFTRQCVLQVQATSTSLLPRHFRASCHSA